MRTLQIVNLQKQAIAEVSWKAIDKLNVAVFVLDAEKDLKVILDRARDRGIPCRRGKYDQETKVLVHGYETVGINDERFLDALSEIIGQLKFNSQRVFGLIKQN